MLGFILLRIIGSKLIDKSKDSKLISRQYLSTFFFDDLHEQISIFGKKNTYFFISASNPNSLTYSIIDKSDKRKLIVPKEDKISNENEYIKVNFSKTIFKLDSTIKSNAKRVQSQIRSSISFISFEKEDECQSGIQFISSQKEGETNRKLSNKCFYLPPDDETPAVLYTSSHVFESSLMKRSQAMDFSKFSIRKNMKNKNFKIFEQAVDLKSLTFSNSKSLSISDRIFKETATKSSDVKHSILSIIVPIISVTIICGIVIVFVCASKDSVEAESPLDQNQSYTPTTKNYSNTLSPYANACNSSFMQNTYMDTNAVYTGVVQYQGALPMKRHMKDNMASGILNAGIPA